MANTNSALYLKLDVNRYLADARDRGGRVVPIPFEHVTAAEVVTDTVNLCVLPANCEVIDMRAVTPDGLGASVTVSIGDSGSATRYALAATMAAAEASLNLAGAGLRFRPTQNTIVFATFAGATNTAGRTIRGVFLIVPGT